MILLTAMPPSRLPGAIPTAPVARQLAAQLLAGGSDVRVLSPSSQLHGWPEGVELVEGAVTDPAASAGAFEGIEAVALSGLVSIVPERLRELTNLAIAGGARRISVLSSHGSDFETEYSPETWQWLAFERALERHGVDWTHVRPTGVFANAIVGGYPISGADWASDVRAALALHELYPEVAYPFMDEADVAGVIARTLVADGYARRTLDVGGVLVSAADRARQLGSALAREIQIVPLGSAEQAQAYWRNHGWPEITIQVTLFAATAYATDQGHIRPVLQRQITDTEQILQRPVRSFEDWLADHLDAFRNAPCERP
jgi:uncharacterized protein YbjT (DUF2867 family)